MKNTYLTLCFALLSFAVMAQLPKGFELQETIEEGKLLVLNKKGKEGLFSLVKNDFVIKPGNYHFYYVKRRSCLFQADLKKGVSAYCTYPYSDSIRKIGTHASSIVFGRSEDGNLTWGKRLFKDYSWEEINDLPNAYEKMSIGEIEKYHFSKEKFGVRIQLGQFIECLNFKDLGDEYDLPLISVEGYDSIDANGFMVYPPRDPAILKSGLWDAKSHQWKLPQVYKDFNWIGAYCFALNGDAYNDYDLPFYYDIVGFEKGKEVFRSEKIKNNASIPYHKIFPKEIQYISRDSVYVVFSEDDKMGLHAFCLFDYPIHIPSFYYSEILPAKYDAIIESGHPMRYYTKQAHEYNMYEIGEDRWYNTSWNNQFFIDYQEYESTSFNLDKKAYVDADSGLEGCSNSKYRCLQRDSSANAPHPSYADVGMKVLNDTLLYVKYVESEGEFIPLINMWGEDSIDENGNTWYYPPDPGVYESGVFNAKTMKWYIEPTYDWIVQNKQGFLLAKPMLNDKGNLQLDDKGLTPYLYSFLKNDGTYSFQNISDSEYHSNYQHLAIWDADADGILENNSINSTHFYYTQGEQMGLASRVTNEKITEPRSYIKSFNRFNRVSIVKDQLMIENGNGAIYLPMDKNFGLVNYLIYSAKCYGDHGYKIHYKDSVLVVQDGLYISDPNDTIKPIEEVTKSPVALRYEDFNGKFKSSYSGDSYGVFRLINTEELVIVQDMKTETFDFPLMDMWGEDSIDMNGNYVYPPATIYPHSGVYNKTKHKWIVPLQYEFVHQVGNFIYAEFSLNGRFRYDVYDLDGTKMRTIELKQYEKELHSQKDVFWHGKLSFWFHDAELITASYSEVNEFSMKNLKEVIVNTADPYGNQIDWFYEISEKDTMVIYPNIMNHENKFEAPHYEYKDYERGKSLLFKKLNDSLVYIENFKDEYQVEIGLVDMYGYDSIDVNGNLAYPEPDPQEYYSGIYNFVKNKWLFPNNYRRIVMKNGAYYGELMDDKKNTRYHKYNTAGVLVEENAKISN